MCSEDQDMRYLDFEFSQTSNTKLLVNNGNAGNTSIQIKSWWFGLLDTLQRLGSQTDSLLE